jgi:hypothetical protein
VCIFAYGQTGSGKTHTMSGTDTGSPEGRGLNYRALDDLFAIRDTRRGEVRSSAHAAPHRAPRSFPPPCTAPPTLACPGLLHCCPLASAQPAHNPPLQTTL